MIICGIDEAGRGPLAGPVTAASVILPKDFPFEALQDSKKLSEKKRLIANKLIRENALCWGIGWAWQKQIDQINILQASLLAMRRSYESMLRCASLSILDSITPHSVIVDGIHCPNLANLNSAMCTAKPKADATEYAVMAASILAKTARDSFMIKIAHHFPEYGYEKHKGYPTASHREVCHKIGPSPIQRLTFKY